MLKQILDLRERERTAGRCVRIGQDNAAVRLVIIAQIDAEVLVERHGLIRDAEQITPDRVERIGNVGVEDGLTRAEERLEREREHIVRAVAKENLRRLEAFPLRERGLERFGICVRIDSELRRIKSAQHLGHARRRRIRVFVGVELDDVRGFRLLARHIRVDLAQLIEKRLVHEKAPLLSVLSMSLVYHDKVRKSREVCEIKESVL